MKQRIHQLSAKLINKIAAGEVIVRPASVVKELLENSLDAESERIRVEIGNHSRDITVTDDGHGMPAEDAELALERHTTSKISTYEDIEQLLTRGFRGEALASIAAVSRLEILTHHRDEVAGYRIKVEGGKLKDKGAIGIPYGTTIKVRDLFYNTPARLKFLGTPRTEMNHITKIFIRQALSCPTTGFTLVSEGKTLMDLPSRQSLRERVIQILGPSLADSLLEVRYTNAPLDVHGLIARPEETRKDRGREFFFVNGRPITSRSLCAALEQAYKGYLMTRRFPISVIFIDIKPGEVDVNVHPTKEEVRFTREYLVSGSIHRAAIEALRTANLTRDLKMPGIEGVSRVTPAPEKPELVSGDRPPSFFSKQMEMIRRKTEERRSAEQKDLGLISGHRPGEEISRFAPSPGDDHRQTTDDRAKTVQPEKSPPAFDSDSLVALGQIADRYIIAGYGEGALLIDQHAAHERLMYEKLKRIPEDKIPSQNLLIPVKVEVGMGDIPLMEHLCSLVKKMGIELEPFGGNSYIVRSIPADLENLDVEGMIFDLLDDLRQTGAAIEFTTFKDKILIRLACRSAIKSGQKLKIEEQQKLVDDIRRSRLGFTCPHGRPTMILLTRDELDKQFKRK